MIKEMTLTGTADAIYQSMGIDSLEYCKDPLRFKLWKKQVTYMYNYLGYRDNDWPEDVSNQTWCVGDSFTLGLGQSFEDTWPQLLSKKISNHVINISMNGASNDWIARRVAYILQTFQPENILIQWSFLHRRELNDVSLLDEDKAIWFDTHDSKDLENFLKNVNLVELHKNKTKVIHSFIPNFADFERPDQLHQHIYQYLDKHNIVYFASLEQLDFARDGFHYGEETAEQYAQEYFNRMRQVL